MGSSCPSFLLSFISPPLQFCIFLSCLFINQYDPLQLALQLAYEKVLFIFLFFFLYLFFFSLNDALVFSLVYIYNREALPLLLQCITTHCFHILVVSWFSHVYLIHQFFVFNFYVYDLKLLSLVFHFFLKKKFGMNITGKA